MNAGQITLAQCIAQVESSGNPFAVRFEPALFNGSAQFLSIQDRLPAWADEQTQRMINCTSWGAFQIMGFNLYDLGYPLAPWDFLGSTEDQEHYLWKFFEAHIARSIATPESPMESLTASDLNFIGRVYNGNGPQYSQALLAAYKELQAQ